MQHAAGLAVVALVLAVASAFAVLRRRQDGAFRTVGRRAVPVSAGSVPAGPAAPASSATQPTGSATEPAEGAQAASSESPGSGSVLASLGVTHGTPLTLVQFSSAFCAPCRATRVLCAETATRSPGVRHIEVDAEQNLAAVRALQIWRTPTVLLVDAEGQIRQRATGAPTRAQLRAAVTALLPAAE